MMFVVVLRSQNVNVFSPDLWTEHIALSGQVKFREFLATEYGEAQLDFLLEAMKLETLPAGEQEQAATNVRLRFIRLEVDIADVA